MSVVRRDVAREVPERPIRPGLRKTGPSVAMLLFASVMAIVPSAPARGQGPEATKPLNPGWTPPPAEVVGGLPPTRSCRLRGVGIEGGTPLEDATPRPLEIPTIGGAQGREVDRETAARAATARAAWQWGPSVKLSSIVPIEDPTGSVLAWDVDFTLDGSSFGSYTEVASEWREFCAQRISQLEERAARGESAAPRDWSSKRYGSVTVSGTLDAPPIRGSRAGVSAFYATGWKAAEVARRVLGTPDPGLRRILFEGSWERLFEFGDDTRSILVQGHEPWGYYDAEEYLETTSLARTERMQWAEGMALDRGRTLAALQDSLRGVNARLLDRWLRGDFPERSPVYILGYNAEFIPYRWFGGCTPTSGGMVLNYYDELGYYGRITYDYTRKVDPVDGSEKCHTSDAIGYLRTTMHTDNQGVTFFINIHSGMLEYANAYCGYSFSNGIDVNSIFPDWHFPQAQAAIDGNHPFVWSLTFYPAANGDHSVAVVGYDTAPDPDEFACYNTWTDGGHIEFAPHTGGVADGSTYVSPYPGGAVVYDAKLTAPDGDQTYNSCLTLTRYTGGQTVDITWNNWGTPAHHVDLAYSTDGGSNWTAIVSGTADDNRYSWIVPCVSTHQGRVRIKQYSGSGELLSSDSSYGEFKMFPPIIWSAPTLLSPASGASCQPPSGILDWEDAQSAVSYEVQLGTSCGTGPSYQVTSSQYAYSGLSPGTTYSWRVRLKAACGVWGPYSNCLSFTTGPVPLSPPALLSPADGATCLATTGSLDWNDVTGANGYRVQMGLVCGGSSATTDVTGSGMNYSGLEAGRTYYWRVATKDLCGNYGAYSTCWLFTCDGGPPPAPALLSPPNGSTNQLVTGTLDWQDVPEATSYRVRLGTACGSGSETLISPPVSQFGYADLQSGTTYYWQVQTRSVCNGWGPYSGCFSFTTRPSATWLVKADGTGNFPTIQAAIDGCSVGDVIELADGIFQGAGNRDLDYHGKGITVRSRSGSPAACIIDCGGTAGENHRGFYFHAAESYGSILDKVTIQNGYAAQGGGIYIGNAAPLIRGCEIRTNIASSGGGGIYCNTIYTPILESCVIYGNSAGVDGGGIYCLNSQPSFQTCTIRLCHAGYDGGGLMLWNSSATLDGCVLLGNSAGDDGGAFALREGSHPNIANCVIAGNTATDLGGAVYSYGNVVATIGECTFSENGAGIGGGFALRSTSTATLRKSIVSFATSGGSFSCDGSSAATCQCSDIYGNAGGDWTGCVSGQQGVNGNISADPLYCFAASYNFALHSDSPCRAAANPTCGLIGALDVDCGPAQPMTVLIRPDGSGDYPTIQAALLDLPDGSIVELADGIFTGPGNRDLDYAMSRIVVQSQGGNPASCIIDCQGSAQSPHRAVDFDAEPIGAALQNVTIRNGYVEEEGGAIRCRYSSNPIISGCVFEGNISNSSGGAIYCDFTACPTITECVFRDNFAADYGGAVDLWNGSSPAINGCRFIGNVAQWGGALDAYSDSSPAVTSCTFDSNEAISGGSIFCEETTLSIGQSTFYGNAAPVLSKRRMPDTGRNGRAGVDRSPPGGSRAVGGAAITVFTGASATLDRSVLAFSPSGEAVLCDGGAATLTCCDVYGNAGGDWAGCIAEQAGAGGNFSADPMFCDPSNDNLTVLYDSPCAAQNQPTCGQIGSQTVACGLHLLVKPDGSGAYPTIQAAIDAAGSQDVIELAPGTYTGTGNRDLDYHGKVITVRSQTGDAANCVIDCQGSPATTHRGFYFHTGEGGTSVLDGVTITGGYTGWGAALLIASCSPTIRNCVFRGNHATDTGGAIHNYLGNPSIIDCLFETNLADNAAGGLSNNGVGATVTGCVFRGNWARWGGGGMYNYSASPTLEDCIFDGNTSDNWGGGLHNSQPASQPHLSRCTFVANAAPYGGAIYNRADADVTVDASILAFNGQGGAVTCITAATTSLTCSDVFQNAGGDWTGCIAGQGALNNNMSVDPLFCDAANHDMTLHADSPCAPDNSPLCGRVGAEDVGCLVTDATDITTLPSELSLGSGQPNPFHGTTTMVLAIPGGSTPGAVIVNVYDAAGRLVRTLLEDRIGAGRHRLTWDGTDGSGRRVPSGTYFVRMSWNREVIRTRLVLIR
jgi:predicted outer membrane repeat protein